MKYHLITPFSRPENFEDLKSRLAHLNLDWHLLLDDPCPFNLAIGEYWIHTYSIPKIEPPWKMWRRCINWFVQNGRIVDDDRYLILADDCAYEAGFFDKLEQAAGEVLIVSMKRGDHIPEGVDPIRAHGTDTLIAAPENMHMGAVSAEQIVLSGRLFKRINLIVNQAADGYMIEAMVHDFGAVYLPEAFVYFNWYEPGRWDK